LKLADVAGLVTTLLMNIAKMAVVLHTYLQYPHI